MLKLMSLSLIATMGFAGLASASTMVLPVPPSQSAIVLVGEGCGYGLWRSGLDNRCRRIGRSGHGVAGDFCPAGWHIGPDRRACWPNR